MMELAGGIADGVLMNYLVSPEYNKRALEFLSCLSETCLYQR